MFRYENIVYHEGKCHVIDYKSAKSSITKQQQKLNTVTIWITDTSGIWIVKTWLAHYLKRTWISDLKFAIKIITIWIVDAMSVASIWVPDYN